MHKPLSGKLFKSAALLLGLGFTLALIVIGAYFSIFGPQSGFTLAVSDVAWSNFGSYVGGVLGPIFSFLAFVGVLLTVYLQAMQLDTLRSQANHEEIQRVASTISSRIDSLLSQAPNKNIDDHRLRNAPITIFTLISGAGSAALALSSDYIVQASRDKLIANSKAAIETEISTIALELDQLVWCLEQYEKQSGSTTVVEFYKRRYNALVCWLDAIGELDSDHRVQGYFQPKTFRQYLEPAAKPRKSST
jgi:hypothetical protein